MQDKRFESGKRDFDCKQICNRKLLQNKHFVINSIFTFNICMYARLKPQKQDDQPHMYVVQIRFDERQIRLKLTVQQQSDFLFSSLSSSI